MAGGGRGRAAVEEQGMNEEASGSTRYSVQVEANAIAWVDQVRAADLIAKKLREKHPEAEIVIEIRVR